MPFAVKFSCLPPTQLGACALYLDALLFCDSTFLHAAPAADELGDTPFADCTRVITLHYFDFCLRRRMDWSFLCCRSNLDIPNGRGP
jgi:hypothetical protein